MEPTRFLEFDNSLSKILKNKYLENTRGIIDALSIQLPERYGIELFEMDDELKEYFTVSVSFIESIIWRKKETLHPKVMSFLKNVVFKIHGLQKKFLDTILLITSQPNHVFNSDFLDSQLRRFSMADRDSWWTQYVHRHYPGDDEDISSIKRMIDWAWTEDQRVHVSDESIRLMSQTICWFLTSSNRTLRDSATKAIICLLDERINILINIVEKFHNINDQYVAQRIYAIAFGCATRTSDIQALKNLADVVFKNVFNSKEVVPDILLRDYARNIIEFAINQGHKFDFDLRKIRPPYRSKMPSKFPSDKMIEKYEVDYKSKNYKYYHYSIHQIINSMKTNEGGRMYGDFGRYTFQSAFSDWKGVNSQKLSNLAVKWIFDKYGYDPKKHGNFDRHAKSHNNYNRHYVFEERIGKKYQWIAFYELLARVSDNYNCYENIFSYNNKKRKYLGPWNPYVRDIDPTIVIRKNYENLNSVDWWNKIKYLNWNGSLKDWIFNRSDLIDPLEMINLVDDKGEEWLVLEVNPSFTEPSLPDKEDYEEPQKQIFYNLSCLILDSDNSEELISWIDENSFSHDLPLSNSRYEVFNREYFWSLATNDFKKRGYDGFAWTEIVDRKTGRNLGKVFPTSISYNWEEQYDASKESTIRLYKPSQLINDFFKLKPSKKEGFYVNDKHEVVCFDPSGNHASHHSLIVRKKDFLEKLIENNLRLVWMISGEKQAVGGRNKHYWGRLKVNCLVTLKDNHFNVKQEIEEERH